MSADEGEQEVPEILDPRQLVILSGEEAEVDFEYSLGVLTSPEPALSCSLVVIGEVDGRVLVAVPAAAWHKTRNQWEFQDPKMEVLYHTRQYLLGYSFT